MMNKNELISLTEQNIRQAVKDYGNHTFSTDVLDDVSDDFIRQLAHDSVVAKVDLRFLFFSLRELLNQCSFNTSAFILAKYLHLML